MSLSDEYRKLRQQREGKTGEKTTSSGQKPLSQQYREKRAASFEREVGEAKLAMWRTMDQNARQASAYEKYKRTMSRIGAGDGNQAADDFSRMQQNARMRPVAERYMQAAVRAGDREMYDEGYRKYLATMDTLDREDAYNRKQESERRKRPSYLGSIRSADQLENDVRQLRGDLDRAESDLTASRNRGGRQETVDMDVPYEEEQARHLYLRRLTPEERAEELRPAPTEEEAQARYDEINARLAQTEQALSYRKMLDIYSMEEKVKARPTFAAEAEAGRQRWEANNAEAEKAAGGGGDVDMGDDTSGSAGYYRAMQKRREQANEAGRNADLDPGWMTDEQKQVYFALYATNPADAARYAEYKQQEMESQHWRKLQEASGKNFLSQAAAFVAGTGGQMIGGAANIIEALSGQPFGETSQSITKAANAMLGGGAEYWDRLSGTIDPDTPIVGDILGGKGLGALYQLASSIVQSGLTAKAAGAVSLAGGTGSEIVEKLGLALMGSQAASSDYTEALQRGMDRNTAMAHAFAAGVAEAAFEEISLDKLVTQYAAPELRKMGWRDLLRDGLRDYFQTAGIEASEEVMTSLANRVSDDIISQAGGYNTQIEQRAKELVALGVSERDAIDKANREWMVDVINDGLGGFISGGFHTFATYTGAAISNQARSLAELGDYLPTATREANTEVKGTRGERRAFGQTIEESGGVEAVQQYAADNGIKAKAYNQDKQSKRQTGRLGRTAQDVTNHMIKQMDGKSLQEQAQVYTGLVEQYGEGIRETANEALRRASMKTMNETQSQRWQNKESFDYIEDPAARSVLEKTQDYLAFNEAMEKASSEGDEKAADYAIGTLRTKGITMEHTVTGEDGKTSRVKIEGLTEDGKRVKLADGTTIKAEELKTDADTRDIFRRFTHDEMGSRANEIFNIMQAEQSAGRTTDLYGWAMDAANVYDQGRQGTITAEEAAKQAKNLSGEAVNLIYNMAREDVRKMDAEARAALQERLKVRQEGATGRKGSVTYSREIADRIAKDEALGHEAERIRRFAEAFGVDVELFASELEDGKYKGKSGQYRDGKIWIDINAGKFKAGDTANGMIYTMAHELTHFMQEYNPEAYRGIKEFALRQIQAQKGRDVLEGLIREKQRRHSGEKALSRERAEDEVAAEFCETMLTEQTVLETLAEENPGLFQTVLDWVKDFLAKIKEKLNGLPAGSYESQVYRAMEKSLQETFGKMWAGGIAGAVQTHDAVGSLAKGKGESQHSDRPSVDNTGRELSEGQQAYFEDSMVRDEDGRLLVMYHGTTVFGEITKFKRGKSGWLGPGVYLTSRKADAQRYADAMGPGNGSLYEMYANVTKPLVVTSGNPVPDILMAAYGRESVYKARSAKQANDTNILTQADIRKLQAKGYDGILWRFGNAVEVSVFDQNQVKRIDNLKPTENSDIRYQDRDTEYLELAKDPEKNAARLQEMVDDAAELAGYTTKAFHGTEYGNKFNTFEESKRGKNHGAKVYDESEDEQRFKALSEKAFYFAIDKEYAEQYGDNVMHVFLREGEQADISYREISEMNPEEIRQLLDEWKSDGIDSFYIHDYDYGNDEIGVFYSEQIKSADPVTYDDSGNVIPLSQRFNTENEDIRYQDRSYDLPSDAELIAGIDESQVTDKEGKDALREAKAAARKIRELNRKLERMQEEIRGYEGEDPNRISVKDFTKKTLDLFSIPAGSRADAGNMLQSLADGVLAGQQLTQNDVMAFFEYLLGQGRQRSTADETLSGIRDELKGRKIFVNADTKADFGDDWNSFRKRAFSLGIILTNNKQDTGVDTVNAEMAELYPGSFSENETDMRVMLETMVDVAESGRTSDVSILEAMQQTEKQTGESVREQLQTLLDQFTRQIDIMKDRAAVERKARAGNAAEAAKARKQADKAKETLKEVRKQRDAWKRKATGAESRQARALDNALRKVILRDASQIAAAVRQKQSLANKLEKQLQREQKILAGTLKPPAIQRMLRDARETAAKQMAEHKEEVYASRKQRHRESEIRNRIKSLHAEMQRELFNPREGHFIPQAFVRPVTELLQMIDTDRNAFRMRKLDEQIAEAKTAEQAEKLQGQRAELEQKQAKAADKINAINSAYDQLKKDERYSMYYDDTVKDMLVELAGTVGDKSLYELNGDELSDVYTVMKAMRTTMRNAIKADMYEKGKTIYEAGDRLIDELRRSGGPHRFRLFEKYHMTQLSAERAFNRFGGYQKDSGWNRLYKMLDDAQLKMINLEMQGTRIFDPVLKSKEAFARAQDLTSTKEKDLVDVGLKDEDGKAVKITRGMMLALYMHLQNEQNMRHVMYGGLTLPDLSGYYKGAENAWGRKSVSIPALGARVSNLDQLLDEIGEEGVSKRYKAEEEAVRKMFDSVRAAIEKEMTDYDRKWIELSREFFDGFSRRVLNETTNSMYGFSKARVDNYFPIVTDKNFLKKDFDSIQRNVSLENAGFMKERVKAANPILLEDLTRTVNRQIGNVSRYAGLTEAIKTFNAIYNVQKKGYTTSVKKAMNNAYEDVGQKYVENLVTDMVGGRQEPANFLDRVRGLYAQGVLSANISVTIKQAASFPTAAATVGWAPLMKALAKGGKKGRVISRADRALIDTYSPLLWYRAKGAIDTEIGDMAHAQDWTKKAKWLMGWIEKADIATVGRLWSAAEYYVDKHNPGLEKGTEAQIKAGESAYYRKVAEVFNKIVEDTQPNYTVLQRPDILRNPNKLVKSLVMFSTQRLQNANILIDAAAEYNAMRQQDRRGSTEQTRAARKAAKAKLTNAITSQAVSTIVLNVMTLAAGALLHRMNPWRDDDDELTAGSVTEEFLNGFLSTVSGSFLLGTETYEAIHAILTGSKYYENDVGGISTINSVLKSVVDFGQDAVKLVSDEDFSLDKLKDKAWKNLYSTAGDLSQITGVPVQNIWKILEGAYRHGEDIVNGEFFSFESGVTRKAATNAKRYWEAYEAGDAEKMGSVLAEMRDNYKADGKSEKKTEDLIRNAIGKLVTEAWDSEEIDLAEAEKRLEQTGLFDDEKLASRVLGFVREEVTAGSLSDEAALAYLSKYKPNKKDSENWATLQEWKAKGAYEEEYRAEHGDEDEVDYEDFDFEQYGDVFAAVEAGKDLGAASKDLLAHGYTEKQIRDAAVDHVRELLKDGKVSESKAVSLVQKYKQIKEDGTYRPATADEAWFTVREWSANNAHAEDEDYSYKKYEDVYKAIDGGLSISTAVKALTDHGVKEEDVKEQIKGYLKKQYLAGAYSESKLKEHWKRYLNTSATEAKQVARWLELQRKNPTLKIEQSRADSYYDGTTKTRENGHASAQAAGMTIQQYLEAKEILGKVKGVDKDGNGRTDDGSTEIAYIQTIAKMKLTSGQKWALYYEKYKGANRKKGIWPTW